MFFYGTLMTPFNRPGRTRVSSELVFKGRGSIHAALYDVGIYPAAIPTDDGGRVKGEVYEIRDPAAVLATLDEIEGYRANEPERSLYMRRPIGIFSNISLESTAPVVVDDVSTTAALLTTSTVSVRPPTSIFKLRSVVCPRRTTTALTSTALKPCSSAWMS